MALSEETARRFARAVLGHVGREYPNSPGHVLGSDADALPPRALHPAFFGSYDWHSCVHGWWTLLTLLRLHPGMPEAAEITALAHATFIEDKLARECDYFERPESRGFERPYGWGWLLALHAEAERHEGQPWAARLEPLARLIASRFTDYLRRLTYPITVGTHFNTAFALTLARDWAGRRDPVLLATGDEWALAAFGERRNYAGWEPGGDEFLSPVLAVALLMSRVMPAMQFEPWVEGLVLANGWVERECRPVTVSDRSDGKIAHLDGLNLSRAWCLWEIAGCIPQHEAAPMLRARGEAHYEAAIDHVTGDYMGEHWLASFALLAALARARLDERA